MFNQEGYDLLGAAFEVYNELGYGMAEDVYQSALEIELVLRQEGRFGVEALYHRRSAPPSTWLSSN
ncbi:MAG: GxxExxY protein [Pirellulaceae bacterium]|jgi:GxxExxY protein